MPAGDFTEAEFSASESARHIAMFNPTNNTVTLREVTVEGFSLEGELYKFPSKGFVNKHWLCNTIGTAQ